MSLLLSGAALKLPAAGGSAFDVESTATADIGQVGSGASGGSGTTAAQAIGAADSDREVFVFCWYQTFDSGTFTVSTIGGQSATLLSTYNVGTPGGGGFQLRVYSATVTSGTTAAIAYSTDAECFGTIVDVVRVIDGQITDHDNAAGDGNTTVDASLDTDSAGHSIGYLYSNNGSAPTSYTSHSAVRFTDAASINDLAVSEDDSPSTSTPHTETATTSFTHFDRWSVFHFEAKP